MVKHYVGARYVPKFASPLEWAADTSYEALTTVTFNNASYTSKVPVPPIVGDPADNPDYWALTGNYNAQVEQYRQEAENYNAQVDQYRKETENYNAQVDQYRKETENYNVQVEQYRQETETVSNNLTTEITNRKNADTTLQGNLNSEASTRAAADSNLQSQINQIVAPSGEAPSAAEVQNARIGANGVTYNTLGNAIREQITELKNDLNGFNYSLSGGGSGQKEFPIFLPKNIKYTYTNLSSGGQNLSVTYTDNTTESISGSIASNTSVTIQKTKDIKAVSGWYTADAHFTIISNGVIKDLSDTKDDISDLETESASMDTRIDAVEDSIRMLRNITPSYSEIGYLTTSGTIYGASSARHTDFVPVEGYDKIIAEAYVPNGVYAVAFFTSNSLSTLIAASSVVGDNKVDTIYKVAIPSSAKYAMMSHLTTGSFIGDPKAVVYLTNSIDNKLTDSVFNSVFSRCAFMAYHKFGVIGDSLSVGYTGNPISGQDSNRNIAYSWPQYLARMCGNIALNFGYSGLTSKTWLSSQYGYTRLIDVDNLCQGYILALGVNDTAKLTLGTVEDIGTEADTFYRYYSDIIALVNETAPNAHIFTLTMPYPINQTSNSFNEAIRMISAQNQFNNVYLVDLAANYNDYFKDDKINGEKSAGHFSCIGYANIAGVMARALSDVMNANPDDFISIPFLPYGRNDVLD